MPTYGNTFRSYGELSYGESGSSPLGSDFSVYHFPPTYTLSMRSKDVMMDNGDQVKYVRNELTVHWILPYEYVNGRLNPDATPESVDTAVQQIRAILMQPGKRLACTYQGYGPAKNTPAGYGFEIDRFNDRANGPMPIDFTAKSLANQRCVEMTWTVAVHTPSKITFDSENEIVSQSSNVNDLSWLREYSIDELGLATITTSGKIEMKLNQPQGSAWDHVQKYRILAAFPVPFACQRVDQKFRSDPNTREMTFSIVDKQHTIENAQPPKALRVEMSHELGSSLFGSGIESGKGFMQWVNTISGTITLPPGEPFVTAYLLFWFYARQRLSRSESGGITGNSFIETVQERFSTIAPNIPVLSQEKVRNIVTKVHYKENMFGRTHQFRLEYTGIYNKEKLLEQSGLFTPLYNYKQDSSGNPIPWYSNDPGVEPWQSAFNRSNVEGNWLDTQWRNYMSQFRTPSEAPLFGSPWSLYGYMGNAESTSQPTLFIPQDYSLSGPQPKVNAVGYSNSLGAWVTTYPQDQSQQHTKTVDQWYSSPERTYMDYQCSFEILEDVNTFQYVRQKFDNRIDNMVKSFQNSPGFTPLDKYHKSYTINNQPTSADLPSADDIVSSYNGQSQSILVLTGHAVRAGFPPTIPSAFSYGGKPLTRAGRSSIKMVTAGRGQMPTYVASWVIPYYIDTNQHANVFANLVTNAYSGVLT